MFDIAATATCYALETTIKDLVRIIKRDCKGGNENRKELHEILDSIDGVDQVEYNGHFGPYIFFRVSCDFDNDAVLAKVSDTVKNYLEICNDE